ncbi:hypothetical protein B296_00017802, partial [Ensete ventricosum]
QQPPTARLPCDSPRRTPLPPSSSPPRDQRLQPATTPSAIVVVSSPLPPVAHPPSLPPLLCRCPSLPPLLLAIAHPFFLPAAAAGHHIPISPTAAVAPNVDAPAASSRRSSLSFLGHAQPPFAALVAATQPLPPLLYSSRSQPLPSPHLPSSSPRQRTTLVAAAFLSFICHSPADLHRCLALLLNRCRQPLFSIGSDISHSPRRPPTTRRIQRPLPCPTSTATTVTAPFILCSRLLQHLVAAT